MYPAAAGNEGGTSVGRGGDRAELRTFDSFGFKNVSLVKIDVEGHEDAVLEGARATIGKDRPVLIVEILGGNDYATPPPESKAKIDATKQRMVDLGYSVTRVSPHDYSGCRGVRRRGEPVHWAFMRSNVVARVGVLVALMVNVSCDGRDAAHGEDGEAKASGADLANPRMRYVNETWIRSRARYLYLGESTGLCRVVGQHNMYVDTSDVGHATHLMLDGFWEIWTTTFFYAHIRPGMHVVDVGASFGYYTLIAAGLVGAGGRVTAFEPNPRVKRLLDQSIRINDFSRWASVRGEAVSDQAGEAQLWL